MPPHPTSWRSILTVSGITDPTVLGGCYWTVNFSFVNSRVWVFLVRFGFKASAISHLVQFGHPRYAVSCDCVFWTGTRQKGRRRRKTVSMTLVILMIAAGFSSRRPEFHTMIFCMVFVVDKVALEQTRTWVFLTNCHSINAPHSLSYQMKLVQLAVSVRQVHVKFLYYRPRRHNEGVIFLWSWR